MNDHDFMKLALRIAKRNVGITSPNPTVGCVIVKNDIIIATGVTAKSGRPHAEFVAINKAIKQHQDISGATLYVTLEPCSHFGKTPPCTDLIIKYKISRVVIAITDPDSRVNGNGIKKLQEAGIDVTVGILEEEAIIINKGFFNVKKTQLPLVTLKLATSLDGKIATRYYDSKWITNEESRQYSHYLRAKNDAILIGSNTLKKDNPLLNCRIKGLEHYSPQRIIVSNNLDIDLNSNIIQTARNIPTYIATISQNQSDLQKFINYGLKIIHCKTNQSNRIDFKDLLTHIADLGINNLLVEGGSITAGEFLKEQLVDKLIWIQSNKIIGNDGIAAIGDLNLKYLSEITKNGLEFRKTQVKEFGQDTITSYQRKRFNH